MKMVVCAICGKSFETEHPNKKYCSLVCRESGRLCKRMGKGKERAEYMREYMREYRKAQKA